MSVYGIGLFVLPSGHQILSVSFICAHHGLAVPPNVQIFMFQPNSCSAILLIVPGICKGLSNYKMLPYYIFRKIIFISD